MSPRKQLYTAVLILVVALIFFGALAVRVNSGWALGMFIAGISFGIWNLSFACPKCGKPYLWEMRGIICYPLSFPKQCRNCGLPTDQRGP